MSALVANKKIIDLINEKGSEQWSSVEFFPPRTDDGVKNLEARLERIQVATKPVFTDFTWGAGGSTADLTLTLCKNAKAKGHTVNMHLTCTNMAPETVDSALEECLEAGITNIVALRGDPPAGESEWKATEGGFSCALDLVKHMREKYGNKFGISVAGYPEGHPNAISKLEPGEELKLSKAEQLRVSCTVDEKTGEKTHFVCKDADYEKELDYLKLKCDAGADFILTQMFFDPELYGIFVSDCKKHGISTPVIPGIMAINNYGGFKRMTGFCKTRVPDSVMDKLESMKEDEPAIKAYGIAYGLEFCKRLLELGTPGLHFYTLNLEKVVYGILDGLKWTDTETALAGMLKGALDSDANSMKAVGSAWARVGDSVTSVFGTGVIRKIRSDGFAEIVMGPWKLAYNQDPIAYLTADSYTKI